MSIPKGYERKDVICECDEPARCSMPYHLTVSGRRVVLESRIDRLKREVASLRTLFLISRRHRRAA